MVMDKGSFVRIDGHPEYGMGRIISIDTFSTRVLFASGGVRVYKNSDSSRLKGATPSEDEKRVLDEKEASMKSGVVDRVPTAKAAPKKAAKATKKQQQA